MTQADITFSFLVLVIVLLNPSTNSGYKHLKKWLNVQAGAKVFIYVKVFSHYPS